MPIANTISLDKEMVFSVCAGKMSEDDFDTYIDNVWSKKRYYGYNELFDISKADWNNFEFVDLLQLASTTSNLKTVCPNSKQAWIVKEGKQEELTEFYKAAKTLTQAQSRALKAFYSWDEALEWLNN